MTPGVFIVCLLKIRQAFEIHHKRYFIGGTKHEKEAAGLLLGLTLCLSLAACGGTDDTSSGESGGEPVKYLIGISQYGQHGSLDNCREGFMAGLAEEGIEEGVNLTVLYDNSQADGGTASQIATNFAGKGVDLMCGIATPMAQAEYGVAKKSDIPVIFTAVTDPVAAELANADALR